MPHHWQSCQKIPVWAGSQLPQRRKYQSDMAAVTLSLPQLDIRRRYRQPGESDTQEENNYPVRELALLLPPVNTILRQYRFLVCQ